MFYEFKDNKKNNTFAIDELNELNKIHTVEIISYNSYQGLTSILCKDLQSKDVAVVKFSGNNKCYYYNNNNLKTKVGDKVLVPTSKGYKEVVVVGFKSLIDFTTPPKSSIRNKIFWN